MFPFDDVIMNAVDSCVNSCHQLLIIKAIGLWYQSRDLASIIWLPIGGFAQIERGLGYAAVAIESL